MAPAPETASPPLRCPCPPPGRRRRTSRGRSRRRRGCRGSSHRPRASVRGRAEPRAAGGVVGEEYPGHGVGREELGRGRAGVVAGAELHRAGGGGGRGGSRGNPCDGTGGRADAAQQQGPAGPMRRSGLRRRRLRKRPGLAGPGLQPGDAVGVRRPLPLQLGDPRVRVRPQGRQLRPQLRDHVFVRHRHRPPARRGGSTPMRADQRLSVTLDPDGQPWHGTSGQIVPWRRGARA